MTQSNPTVSTFDCLVEMIVGCVMPFFLTAAGGNQETARNVARDLVTAFNANTVTEMDLAGRVVGFSIASLDNLRLSMTPELSDSMTLRYRNNAITLSRGSDHARTMLETLQAGKPIKHDVPRPSVAVAPPARKPVALAPSPVVAVPMATPMVKVTPMAALSAPSGQSLPSQAEIEAAIRDARLMMTTFSKHGASAAHSLSIADPATMASAAARAAVGSALRTSAA